MFLRVRCNEKTRSDGVPMSLPGMFEPCQPAPRSQPGRASWSRLTKKSPHPEACEHRDEAKCGYSN